MPAKEFRKSVCLCDSIRHGIKKLTGKFTTYAFFALPLYLLTEEGNVGLYLTARKTGNLVTKKHEFYPCLVKSLECNFVYPFYFTAVRDDEC